MFDSILNPILRPLLSLPSLWAILIISVVISVIVTLVYKWITDQNLMKTLKEDMKKFQQEMKEFRQDPKKVMEIQKKAMETNMKYMMHSMKPTLITFIPIILIFGWLNAHIAYEPIMPGQEFTTAAIFDKGVIGDITIKVPEEIQLLSDAEQQISDAKAEWLLKGEAGEYLLEYDYNNATYKKEVLITTERAYANPLQKVKNNNLKELTLSNEKVRPLFGLSWIWTYIIFSIVFSMILRKILKIH